MAGVPAGVPASVPAPAAGEGPDNPFVAMAPRHRLLVLGAGVAYLLAVYAANLSGRGGSSGWVVVALTVFMTVRLAPLIFFRNSWGWFHPVVFASLVTLLTLFRRFPSVAFGFDAHAGLNAGRGELMDLLAVEFALSTLAVLSYYAGFFFLPGPRVPKLQLRTPPNYRRKAVIAVGLAFIVFLVYMESQGGLVAHLLSWGGTRRAALSGEYYWLLVIRLGAVACTLWLAVDPRAFRNPFFLGCVALALPPLFLASGSRSAIIYTVIVALIVWMLRSRRVAYTRVVLGAAMAVMILVPLGELRESTWGGALDWSTVTRFDPVEAARKALTGEVTSRVAERSTLLAVLARVPDDVDYLYGKSYLAVLTLPVPRKLWPEKPQIGDAMAGEVFFSINAGMVLGPVGEAYWNFGVPGVVLVFLLFGVFHRWLAACLQRYSREPAAIAMYGLTLWSFSGPAGLQFIGWMMDMVPLLILLVATGALRFRALRASGGLAVRAPLVRPLPVPRSVEG